MLNIITNSLASVDIGGIYETVTTAGKLVADELKDTAEDVRHVVNSYSSQIGSSFIDSYSTLSAATSLGTLLLSDDELETYFNEATNEYSLHEKVEIIKNHIRNNPIFKNISKGETINKGDSRYFSKVPADTAFDESEIYYTLGENGYEKVGLTSETFTPSTEDYYVINASVYEYEISASLSDCAIEKLYYGNLYNFLVDNLGAQIIHYTGIQERQERCFDLPTYLIEPKMNYIKPNENFLSLHEIEESYVDTLNTIDIFSKTFSTPTFKNIYYNLITANQGSSICFSNNRVNNLYTLLSYGGHKNNVFGDYRDSLIITSLNGAFNRINEAVLDKELTLFATKIVINMERKYNEYLAGLRSEIDGSFSELTASIADYTAFINKGVADGLIDAGSGMLNALTSFDIVSFANSYSNVYATLGGTFTTYFSNMGASANKLMSNVKKLNSALGRLDYLNLQDNDICAYETYLEYMNTLKQDKFTVNTLDDMLVAEFALLLFKFFSTPTSTSGTLKYPAITAGKLDNNTSFLRSNYFDSLREYYKFNGDTPVKVSSPSLFEYNGTDYIYDPINHNYKTDSRVSSFYIFDSSTKVYYLASSFDPKETYYKMVPETEYDETKQYYELDVSGYYFREVESYDVDVTNISSYYTPLEQVALTLDKFTTYYYQMSSDYIYPLGSQSISVRLFDKTNNILNNTLAYMRIKNKLKSLFQDMYKFQDLYSTIYTAFENVGKFNLNNIDIYVR